MTNKTTKPLLDIETQKIPLKGEVSPEEARFEANVFCIPDKIQNDDIHLPDFSTQKILPTP